MRDAIAICKYMHWSIADIDYIDLELLGDVVKEVSRLIDIEAKSYHRINRR